jgi:hypothetical protein
VYNTSSTASPTNSPPTIRASPSGWDVGRGDTPATHTLGLFVVIALSLLSALGCLGPVVHRRRPAFVLALALAAAVYLMLRHRFPPAGGRVRGPR